jgi:hypothetical protein
MITMDHPPRSGVEAGHDGSETQERERRAHLCSADHCEEHALLLDRFGAHHAAIIERHTAELEREAADAVAQG